MVSIAVAGGLVGGIVLDLLTWWVARYGVSGDGWSLRGNGALIVPLGLGPAILAGGWTALVLRSRLSARWRMWGAGAGLMGALIVVASVAVLMVFGSTGEPVAGSLGMVILVWTVVAPMLAAVLGGSARQFDRPLLHASAGVSFAVSLVASFLGAELVVSPGS